MQNTTGNTHPLQPITDAAIRGRFIAPHGDQLPPGHIALNMLEQLARRTRLLSAACEAEQVNPVDVVAELLAISALADGVGRACEGMCFPDQAA